MTATTLKQYRFLIIFSLICVKNCHVSKILTILNIGRRGFENVVFYINIFKKKGRSRVGLRIRSDLDVFAIFGSGKEIVL